MNRATRIVVSAMGIILGMAGIEHGIGEMLQGSVAPSGIMFQSWPDSEFFSNVAGEPAMTIIPNLLITGIITVLVSVALTVWAVVFIDRKYGGTILMLLSVAMLLVGGGIAPIIPGALISAAASRINSPLGWWRAHLPAGLRDFLGRTWRWVLLVCLAAWLMLFPGLSILAYFFGMKHDPEVIPVFGLVALCALLAAILSAIASDVRDQAQAHGSPLSGS